MDNSLSGGKGDLLETLLTFPCTVPTHGRSAKQDTHPNTLSEVVSSADNSDFIQLRKGDTERIGFHSFLHHYQ